MSEPVDHIDRAPLRKYDLAEIDEMRRHVRDIHNIGGRSEEIVAIHESYLRTYMLNGTSVDELKDAAINVREERFARLQARWGLPSDSC